ncbi:MAG: ABC transporter permease [Lachnospiraceae bacterium]
MRMINPVYKREAMVSARSFKLALVLLIFNGILALVALLNMYSMLTQVRQTAHMQYSSFLDLYIFVAVLEFVMLIFIMPAITAGSISGERERQTLDLMLTTKMTPAEIVFGKLISSMSTMLLMIVSSFPILAMVFVYGGVTLTDMGSLLFCYMAAALFIGSLGICCSAVFKKSTVSTVISYGLMVAVVIGTYGINQFAYYMSRVHADSYLAAAGQAAGQGSSGSLIYLLLMNPTSTFLVTMMQLAGTGMNQIDQLVMTWFGAHEINSVYTNWVSFSVVIQLLLAAFFIWIAIRAVSLKRR